ncbi:MAG TPA: glycerol-3-phosphate 1-O-acyltransferase PlsB [Xanthomonadales bacterium]|nr:glycerol-3-phosphate 1-O-acyltransferase PlsB [Xanthomonadales bacterium]
MSSDSPKPGFLAKLKYSWYMMWRGVLHWWVRSKTLPQPFDDIVIDPDKPVCYVMDSYALSSLLIMDKCCEQLDLPRPVLPLRLDGSDEPRSYLALRRKQGLLIMRTRARSHSEMLERLVAYVGEAENTARDVQLVPVSVLIGRAPDKETGLAKIMFTESWEIAGRLRRLLGTMINGRNTFVRFSPPISLLEASQEGLGDARTLRKVSRILRVHFQRVRSAAIGPDLSHRRTVVEKVLTSPSVRKAISDKARADKITEQKARKIAHDYVNEIAADYSYSFVRIASFALSWFWNRIYDGVSLNHFSQFQKVAADYEVIYVPCHRSHIDYLLLSYLVYHQGFVPPHVAAGVNLNLPVIGRIIRKGGGFYIRRSFRTQKLYSAVFHEYLATIQAQGTSLEYFIEGTRSRTGRLLPPKSGMLAMSVRSYLRNPTRPLMFQPIYIGYERLVEGNSYTAELSGQKKRSESLWDLLNVFRILRERYGKVHVSFADPIFLDDLLDKHEPAWRDFDPGKERKPPWLAPLIDQLGNGIITGINETAHVSSINLLAAILLATPKHAIDREDLISVLVLYLDLLQHCAYSDRVTFTARSAEAIVQYGIEMEVLRVSEHPLGDIIEVNPEQAVRLTYFRNNVSHLLALPSLVAACFMNSPAIEESQVRRIAAGVYPFLKAELFLPWDADGFVGAALRFTHWLRARGLLLPDSGNGHLERAEGGSHEAFQLRLLGRALLQTYERYYITVAVLAKNGSGILTRGEVERLCTLTAQRISQLNEFAAPEFYDKNLFRQFIELLRSGGILYVNESGKFEFTELLGQISDDAKLILSKEIRHAIMKIAPRLSGQIGTDDPAKVEQLTSTPEADQPEASVKRQDQE